MVLVLKSKDNSSDHVYLRIRQRNYQCMVRYIVVSSAHTAVS